MNPNTLLSSCLASTLAFSTASLIGCSGAVPTGQSSAADTASTRTATANGGLSAYTVGTALGNQFTVTPLSAACHPDDGADGSNTWLVVLTYVDVAGYMTDASGNEAASLSAVVSGGGGQTVAMGLGPDGRTFTSRTPFQVVVSAGGPTNEVAFLGPNNRWDSNDGANYDLGLSGRSCPVVPPNQDTLTTSTGVGNQFTVTAVATNCNPDDGSDWTNTYSVSLSYVDSTGYMTDASGHEATTVSAFVSYGNQTIPMTVGADGKTFTNATPFQVVVSDPQLGYGSTYTVAFVSPNNNWDSNNGANYDLGVENMSCTP